MAGENAIGLNEIINERLSNMGRALGELDSRTVAQLEKIESAIQSELMLRRSAEAEARRHDINVATIAASSGVSRATFYNKPILKEYVEDAGRSEGGDADKLKIEALRANLSRAEETIERLRRRDGELVVMMAENERLRKRVEGLEAFIETMPGDMRRDFEARGIVIPFPVR